MNNSQAKKFRQLYRDKIEKVVEKKVDENIQKKFVRDQKERFIISRQRDIVFLISIAEFIGIVCLLIFYRGF